MRTLRLMLVGLCLMALSGCCCHRPFFAHRHGYHSAPCCAPAPHCACYLGAPTPMHAEPPMFAAPMPSH